jgi:hypothetical protein
LRFNLKGNMNIEMAILLAIPVILGAILAVAAGRDWLRARRARREMNRALDQRWKTGRMADWTPADETRWQKMGRMGMLGNDWEKR